MPRRPINPVVQVLAYFQTAPLDAAQLALDLATEAVRQRKPQTQSPKTTKTRKPRTATQPVTESAQS